MARTLPDPEVRAAHRDIVAGAAHDRLVSVLEGEGTHPLEPVSVDDEVLDLVELKVEEAGDAGQQAVAREARGIPAKDRLRDLSRAAPVPVDVRWPAARWPSFPSKAIPDRTTGFSGSGSLGCPPLEATLGASSGGRFPPGSRRGRLPGGAGGGGR